MDNFVISAKTKKELEEWTICFLKVVEKHNLCFKQLKCNFDAKEIPILIVVVGQGEVWMENDKVKAVIEWKTSTKIKEVESFLEFAIFYQWFIKNFSYIVRPLNELKGKKEWRWEDKYQKAFDKLKNKITSQSILILLKRNGKFQVETDASAHTIGGVLS